MLYSWEPGIYADLRGIIPDSLESNSDSVDFNPDLDKEAFFR